jgi:hypothetical protein
MARPLRIRFDDADEALQSRLNFLPAKFDTFRVTATGRGAWMTAAYCGP